MGQMKEQNKTPGKELNEMEISNLSDAEFKTLVIMMLKDIIGCWNSIKTIQAVMKVTLREIKKNPQGIHREPTVEGMKLRLKSMTWNIRTKKTFNQNSKKKKELKKKKKKYGASGTSPNVLISKS